MCGIVGYTGDGQAQEVLLAGLSKLEYRGYDSAGIALERVGSGACELDVVRCTGKVSALVEKASAIDAASSCGIGHTRWATHGRPSEANAHPHVSCDGRIAVVHNGIIENFTELREELAARGHVFRSETDSEVIAHLIEEAYEGREPEGERLPGSTGAPACDLSSALRAACSRLVGAYGIAAVCADEPGIIVVARKDSPIVV